uniref:RRM domain-containing protein n=1 Tax=Physcomitrium patens TaxID=3218 RepID=A0A7I4A6I3_PHYPA
MEGDGVQLHVFGGGNAGATASTVAAAALYSGDAPPQAAAPTMVRERHRVFVKSGVTSEITAEVLHRHFSNFGNVIDVYIPRVLPPQLPKGFAYVSFDCEEAVQRALELESHEIEGKHVPVGRAEPRPSERGLWHRDQDIHRQQQQQHRGYDQPYVPWGAGLGPNPLGPPMLCPPPPSVPSGPPGPSGAAADVQVDPPYIPEAPHYHAEVEPYGWMAGPLPRACPGNGFLKKNACRIFVGGVPDVLSEEDLKVHFEKYGKVEDVYFPKEKETRKRRGFCYVRFDNPKAADAAAARSSRTIRGNEIGEIKIAQPRPGEGPPPEYYLDRDGGYGPGGSYCPQRMGPPHNTRSFEGRPNVIDEVRYIAMAYISVYFVSLACEICASGGAPASVLHPAPALGAHPLSFAISRLSLLTYTGTASSMVTVVDFVVQLHSFVFFMRVSILLLLLPLP